MLQDNIQHINPKANLLISDETTKLLFAGNIVKNIP